jgi:Protein of unknown function (DUF3435)
MVSSSVIYFVLAATNLKVAVASQGVLQQVMNHMDARIYQAYINQRVQCDVQAAFLKRPSADGIQKALTHMRRAADPRALTKRTASLKGIKSHPDIVACR